QRAESLRLAGRPWHAAETLLAASARELHFDPAFILAGAKAELHARRYDRARGLLAGQPWLTDYAEGEGLAVLAEAEARLAPAACSPPATASPRSRPSRKPGAPSTSAGWRWRAATRVGPATPCTG